MVYQAQEISFSRLQTRPPLHGAEGTVPEGLNTRVRGRVQVDTQDVGPRLVLGTIITALEPEAEQETTHEEPSYIPPRPRVRLGELARPKRFIKSYEPLVRQATLEKLVKLFDMFKASLGRPECATRRKELQLHLADIYRQMVRRREARQFATAISMIQDVLQPHWSQISGEKIDAIIEILRRLRQHRRLTPAIVEKHYHELVNSVGSGISLPIEVTGEWDDAEE